MNCATVKFVPGNYSPWKERQFMLFSVTAWDCKAAVVVAGLFMDRVLDNVVRAVGRTDISTGFLGGQIFIRRDCWNQPLDNLVEEGQPQVFTPFLQSREVVLYQKMRNRPRSFRLVVPGYEADCVSLDALRLADVLFLFLISPFAHGGGCLDVCQLLATGVM